MAFKTMSTEEELALKHEGTEFSDLVMCDGYVMTESELYEGYCARDIAWMAKTRKYPPTALQLAVAFGKFATRATSEDDSWDSNDQDALDYSLSHTLKRQT